MDHFKSKFSEFEEAENKISNMSVAELKKNIFELAGIILFEIQKNEFLIHGIVSHAKEDLLKKEKNFKKLNPRTFLDNDEYSRKSRKQTLGIIFNFLLNTMDVFDDSELNNYLNNRNLFIHSFWRDFLSKSTRIRKENIQKNY